MPAESTGAQGRVKKVSVLTATFQRPHYLPHLVRTFKHQTYPDKELVILDDSPVPDANLERLAQSDPEIRYTHIPQRLRLGAKRNLLVEQARGEIVALFDDDDYYAPQYIETMVAHLGDKDFFTLSAWYAYSLKDSFFAYWDTAVILPQHYRVHPRDALTVVDGEQLKVYADAYLWGFGFSYVFKKAVYPVAQFGQDWNDDYQFAQRLGQAGFSRHCLPDQEGLVLHMIHQGNVSCILPQYRLPVFLLPAVFGDDIIQSGLIRV